MNDPEELDDTAVIAESVEERRDRIRERVVNALFIRSGGYVRCVLDIDNGAVICGDDVPVAGNLAPEFTTRAHAAALDRLWECMRYMDSELLHRQTREEEEE